MKRICVIANGYPTNDEPQYAFIQPVVHAFADNGIECAVIVPQSISKTFHRKKMRPYRWIDYTDAGNQITIFQPKYVSLSNIKYKNNLVSSILSDRAIVKCFRKEKINPDIIYAHFWERGIVASQLSKEKKIPIVVASGESKIWVRNYYSYQKIEDMLTQIKGVICVSSKNLVESQDLGLIRENIKTIILPNGYDSTKFFRYDRKIARMKLKIPQEMLIGIFVGAFCERKGSERVVQAARDIDNLGLLMIGSGNLSNSNQILFRGAVPHNELVDYLNAADFFILPTLAEGCCNAIVEAIACGLPVISSNLGFNDDILDKSNSIRVDPTDIRKIKEAIKLLKNDENLRNKLSKGALNKALQLNIKNRSDSIITFLNEVIRNEKLDRRSV